MGGVLGVNSEGTVLEITTTVKEVVDHGKRIHMSRLALVTKTPTTTSCIGIYVGTLSNNKGST